MMSLGIEPTLVALLLSQDGGTQPKPDMNSLAQAKLSLSLRWKENAAESAVTCNVFLLPDLARFQDDVTRTPHVQGAPVCSSAARFYLTKFSMLCFQNSFTLLSKHFLCVLLAYYLICLKIYIYIFLC